MTQTHIQPTLAKDVAKKPVGQRLRERATIARHTTGWGYRVTRTRAMRTSMDLVESSMTLGGAVSVMLTAGLWLLPGSTFAAHMIGIKLGLSLLIGLGGLALLHLARRGLNKELHVDRRRRQLRHVWRNRVGTAQLHDVIEFDEIGSLFLRRHPVAGHTTHLFVRVIDRTDPIELFAGTESEMQGLWNSLKADLRAVPARKQKPSDRASLLSKTPSQPAKDKRPMRGEFGHRVSL